MAPEIVIGVLRYAVAPILIMGLIVAPLVAIIWHRHGSKPERPAPHTPGAPRREVIEVGREFMSAHPVQREGDR